MWDVPRVPSVILLEDWVHLCTHSDNAGFVRVEQRVLQSQNRRRLCAMDPASFQTISKNVEEERDLDFNEESVRVPIS